MERIIEIDAVKIEKEKAMQRYKTFRNLANIARTLEVFVAIVFVFYSISWSSSYVPAVFEFFDGFLRRLSSLLFCHHVVFIICNAIVITLLANLSPSESSGAVELEQSSSENFGEFLHGNVDASADVVIDSPATEIAEVEKESVVEKVYRRSQSAAIVEVPKAEAAADVVETKELRRSTTVPRRKIGGVADASTKAAAAEARRRRICEEDELSNEEFNRKVEEFIQKQKKFLTQEGKSLVLSN